MLAHAAGPTDRPSVVGCCLAPLQCKSAPSDPVVFRKFSRPNSALLNCRSISTARTEFGAWQIWPPLIRTASNGLPDNYCRQKQQLLNPPLRRCGRPIFASPGSLFLLSPVSVLQRRRHVVTQGSKSFLLLFSSVCRFRRTRRQVQASDCAGSILVRRPKANSSSSPGTPQRHAISVLLRPSCLALDGFVRAFFLVHDPVLNSTIGCLLPPAEESPPHRSWAWLICLGTALLRLRSSSSSAPRIARRPCS
jgi:hypothetical protein